LSEVSYSVRVRIGDREIEVKGSKEDVLATLEEKLPSIVERVVEAFSSAEVGGEVVVGEGEEAGVDLYPRIPAVSSCSEGIMKLFSTDWGKRPRTLGEIRHGLEVNKLNYPVTTVSSVLVGLIRQGRLRRWKTSGGYVYVAKERG